MKQIQSNTRLISVAVSEYLLAAISSPSNADDVQYELLQKFESFASAAARETAHGSNLNFTETNWPGGAQTGRVSFKIEEEDNEKGEEKTIGNFHRWSIFRIY